MENKNNTNEKRVNNKINIIYLKKLIKFIIDIEKEINVFKKKYDLKDKLMKIFNLIDIDNKGYFSFKDLDLYLKKYNLKNDSLSIALLFIRLDKNRQGKVNFFEINEEMKSMD